MKKILLIAMILSCGIAFGQSAGDIAFVGYNADGGDDFAFVALAEIADATEIHFTDNEWGGSAFNDTNEGIITWTASGTIAEGSVIIVTDASSGSRSVSNGSLSISGSFNLGASNEALFAFTGTTGSPTFLAAICNDLSGSGATLTGSGLTLGTDAIDFADDNDGYAYSGSRSSESAFLDYGSIINDETNWTEAVSDGETLLPFSTTPFTLAGSPLVGFDATASDETETDATFLVDVAVTLSDYSGSQVDLSVTIDGSSSAEGGDYTLNTSSLSFMTSESQNISISIHDDADEDNETIVLNISETTSTGITITTSQHTITITDDEIPNIIISEIMYNSNNSDGSDDEWIELYNGNGASVDVSNWTIEIGGSLEFTFPGSTTLTDGSYTTIALGSNGDGTFNNGASFTPNFNSLGVANADVAAINPANTNNMVNSSTSITLKTDGGSTADEVTYSDANDSRTDGDGPSYEIIDLTADNSTTASNWQSSPNIGGSPGSFSSVTVWDGSTDSDWSDASNWSNGVPDNTTNAIIANAGTAPTIAAGTEGACNDLTVDASASLTVSSGGSLAIFDRATNNGTYTVEKAVTGSAGYSILGAPISDATINDMSLADYVVGYNNSDDSWPIPDGTASMSEGVGFFVGYDETSPTVSFTGTPNDGTVTYSVTETSGFELVANPYAAAITVADFLNDNTIVTGGVYLWDDGGANTGGERVGDYIAVTGVGAASAVDPTGQTNGFTGDDAPADDGYIASVQGFFVEVNNSGTLTFSADHQTSADGSNDESDHYRSVEFQKVKLAMAGNNLYNEVLVGLGEGATFGVDRTLDAKKFISDSPLSFYTLLEDEKYVIQALPNVGLETMSVPLGFDSKAGTFTMSVVDFENIPENMNVILIDHLTGISYDLRDTETFSFESNVVENDQRFELQFSPAEILSLDDLSDRVKVFGSTSELTIQLGLEGQQDLTIYSLDGKVAFKERVNFSANKAVITPSLTQNEVYVLRVGDQSFKFVIQ